MSREAKSKAVRQSACVKRLFRGNMRQVTLGTAFLALACGVSVSALAESHDDPKTMAAMAPTQELAPKLPENIKEEDLTSPAGLKKLAVVVVVDEAGDYVIYRNKLATGVPSKEPFPPPEKAFKFFETFDVYRTNPRNCVRVGGDNICWD